MMTYLYHVSITQSSFNTLNISDLHLFISSSLLQSSGNHWCFYFPHSFDFSNMSYSQNQTTGSFSDRILSLDCMFSRFPLAFCGFPAHFFLCVITIPFYDGRTSWLLLRCGDDECTCRKDPRAGFCLGIFQLIYVNTKSTRAGSYGRVCLAF